MRYKNIHVITTVITKIWYMIVQNWLNINIFPSGPLTQSICTYCWYLKKLIHNWLKLGETLTGCNVFFKVKVIIHEFIFLEVRFLQNRLHAHKDAKAPKTKQTTNLSKPQNWSWNKTSWIPCSSLDNNPCLLVTS